MIKFLPTYSSWPLFSQVHSVEENWLVNLLKFLVAYGHSKFQNEVHSPIFFYLVNLRKKRSLTVGKNLLTQKRDNYTNKVLFLEKLRFQFSKSAKVSKSTQTCYNCLLTFSIMTSWSTVHHSKFTSAESFNTFGCATFTIVTDFENFLKEKRDLTEKFSTLYF